MFLLLSVVFSCRNQTANADKSESSVVIRLPENPERINPILFPGAIEREIYQYLFQPLADLDGESLEFKPVLIKTIPDLEEKLGLFTITVEILPEASWSDGSPITGADYAFTLKAIMHPECNTFRYKYLADYVEDVQINPENPKQFTIVFGSYTMQMVESVLNFEILPAHVYDATGLAGNFTVSDLKNEEKLALLDSLEAYHAFAENFNSVKFSNEVIEGSGPYSFVSWTPNESVVLKRKDNYWADGMEGDYFADVPAQIVFTVIPDEFAALTQLSEGKVDVVNNISQNGLSVFKDSSGQASNFAVLEVQQPRYYALLLNHKNPILSDAGVRRALDMLHDDKEYIQVFENGEGKDLFSFVPEFLPGHNKQMTSTPFDPEKAKEILSESGWTDTDGNGVLDKVIDGKKQDLHLRYMASGGLGTNIGLLLKDACKAVGIDIEMVQKDFALTRKENLATDDYEIIATVMSVDLFLENPFDSFHSGNTDNSNYTNYQSAAADSLITLIGETRDHDLRLKLHADLQKLIQQDAVMIYLYSPVSRIGINQKWNGKALFTRPGYRANTFEPNAVN